MKLLHFNIKRDVGVEMTVTGKTDDGKWVVQSDLLGIEVEATFEELADCELAPNQEIP